MKLTGVAFIVAVLLLVGMVGCGVVAGGWGPSRGGPWDAPDADVRAAFEIQVGDVAERVSGAAVTSWYLRDAKAAPLVGRLFTEEEHLSGTSLVVLIGADLWQRKFAADQGLAGKKLFVNGMECTVVGILPASFRKPRGAEIWIPAGSRYRFRW